MTIYRLHFVFIILLLVNFSFGRTFVTRAAHDIHKIAVHHTHNLARDLRIVLGSHFIRRADNQRVVYCKRADQSPLVNGGFSGVFANVSIFESATATQSSSKRKSSSTRKSSFTTKSISTPESSFTPKFISTPKSIFRGKPIPTPKSTKSISTPKSISAPKSVSTPKSSSTPKPSITPGSSSKPKATPTSPWKLSNSYQGSNFFDSWDFFTGSDPTNGFVNYVDEQTAWSSGLVGISDQGNAVMRVETAGSVSGNRQSVRISTQDSFNGALVIMDSVHMPTGCGLWPAFWTNGPNWPAGGEIDIVEGINNYTNNQATIHTNVGCTLPSSSSTTLAISGSVVGGTDCAAYDTGNEGCGIRSSSNNSFGAGFNNNGGGVYAMKWDTTGIAVYFFPRGSVPADISADAPKPHSWGYPQGRWPAPTCAPFQYFNHHSAIFDTTLCGDWAGTGWSATGLPGQDQSCAQITGFSTCQAFVQSSAFAMSDAYWEIKSVKIYQL